MDYKNLYNEWLNNEYFDENTKLELKAIENNENEIKERFYCDLEFGTAGLRGILGAGTNRMNVYVVRKATQGIANYIIKNNKQENGVAIAFDSRHMSYEFANEAALCLAANGIKSYVFQELRATPELSFAIRFLNCVAGINVTASHNPKEYNGYKVYWEDGAQLTPPHDDLITADVLSITDYSQIKTMSKEDALKSNLYIEIGENIDKEYLASLKKNIKNLDCIQQYADSIKIVYTPLHGAGNIILRRLLSEIGFKNVFVVPEQELPNGDFPTVNLPNPEYANSYELALKLAKEKDADLILATDPDADRLGAYVKSSDGTYKFLNGNMCGSFLAEYILSQEKTIPNNGYMIKSIVSSRLINAIATNYNVKLYSVLTGFKWIGKKILECEQNKNGTFLFGYEESYGYLTGNDVRDKDAIVSAMLFCDCLAYCKSQNITLWDYMQNIYNKYGFYIEETTSLTFEGLEGKTKISNIMNYFRNNKISKIGNYDVVCASDYSDGSVVDMPKSNVLYYELNNNSWLCVRPSGTEPKVKFYYGICGNTQLEANEKSEKFKMILNELIAHIT